MPTQMYAWTQTWKWKWILWGAVFIVIVGILVTYLIIPPTPISPPALTQIEQAVSNAKEALDIATKASRDTLLVRQSLEKEVRTRNETIHKEVASFDADRIAAELNTFCYDNSNDSNTSKR